MIIEFTKDIKLTLINKNKGAYKQQMSGKYNVEINTDFGDTVNIKFDTNEFAFNVNKKLFKVITS